LRSVAASNACCAAAGEIPFGIVLAPCSIQFQTLGVVSSLLLIACCADPLCARVVLDEKRAHQVSYLLNNPG
jgi:hypothetical protein